MGNSKTQLSIMVEDYEESISLTLRTRSSKKQLGILEKMETPMTPAMLGKTCQKSMVRHLASLLISSQNLRVSWEASETKRMRMEESLPNYHEDHLAGRGTINSLQHCYSVHKFLPMPQAMKVPASKAAVV